MPDKPTKFVRVTLNATEYFNAVIEVPETLDGDALDRHIRHTLDATNDIAPHRTETLESEGEEVITWEPWGD